MAASFDGVDDNYQLDAESTLRWEYTQAFSGHCWIKKEAVAGNCIMGKAQNAPPAADQRGWAFNSENIGGGLALSFHLINTSGVHAFKQAQNVAAGPFYGQVPFLWYPVGFTYTGSGLTSGMTLYAGGAALSTSGSPVDTLAGATILVNGTPVRIAGFDTEFWAGSIAGVTLFSQALSAANMLTLSDIRNMYVHPSVSLGIAPAVWLPLRQQNGVVDLTDWSGNGHDASIGTGAPVTAPDPAVYLDNLLSSNFTTTTSFTYTPINTLSAVCVTIAQNGSSSDLISGVTYGGVAMTRLPTDGFAQDAAGEVGAVYTYVLTSGVLQGAQSVAITVASGSELKTAYTVAMNSRTAVTVAASGKVEGDVDDPSVTLGTLSDFKGLVSNTLFSGRDAPADLTAGAGHIKFGGGRDFGSQSIATMVGNLAGASAASGWATPASDDVAMIAVAFEARSSLVSNPKPLAHLTAR